ncbi:MAG: ADP-ribosylation factor-like protein [Promethearchaeota archaeon]
MPDIKVFLYGLDFAGKTALSETIKHAKTFVDTKPTIRVIISNTLIKNISFYIWDLPGQIGLRDKWLKALEHSKILIFVLDTADTHRFPEAKKEFFSILNHPESKGIPLIFCFHKMDLQEAKNNLTEAQAVFDLKYIKDRQIVLLETSINLLDTIEELKERMVSFFS